MSFTRRVGFVLSGAVLPLLAALFTVVLPASPASAGDAVKIRLYRAVKQLPLVHETRIGYDRDKFRHWIDADGDCRDTRDEVLAQESRVPVSGCDIGTGRWRSAYDGKTVRDAGDLDIDHMVPLAEAWDSGAKRWNASTRKRFANDLHDRRSLVAVTASSNRSKSDRDPAEWMPDRGRCTYVRHWVAVKIRWSLTVDRAEKRALSRQAHRCGNRVIKVREARVRTGHKAGKGGGGTGGGTTAGTDPRFDTCGDAIDHGYGPYVRNVDAEYDWYIDGDSDGVVCES